MIDLARFLRVVAVLSCPEPGFCNPLWLTEASRETDADGRFQLKGVPDGAVFDFLKPDQSDLRNQRLELDGADNTVTLYYGGAIAGRVVDRDGKPIPNFRVLVNFPRNLQPGENPAGFFAGYTGIGVLFSSDDGSFVLTGIGAGSSYRISALADGHGEAVEDRVKAVPLNHLATMTPVTLRAGPPAALRVQALAADGKPISGARVTLVNGESELDQVFSWGYHDASWEDMVRGRTGNDGVADFKDLSFPGATVLVQAPGFARQRLGWRDSAKDLAAKLVPEAVVKGEVRDANGKALRDFYVNLSCGGDQISGSGDADVAGRFRVAELPSGPCKILIRSSEGRQVLYQEEVTLKPGETKELKVQAMKE